MLDTAGLTLFVTDSFVYHLVKAVAPYLAAFFPSIWCCVNLSASLHKHLNCHFLKLKMQMGVGSSAATIISWKILQRLYHSVHGTLYAIEQCQGTLNFTR